MRYFAYGSNMDPVQMARRCPGATAVAAALLPGYRLTFVWDSPGWGGGVGHIEPHGGAEVWGVLWDVSEDHLRSLDEYEQVAAGVYLRETVTVEVDGAPVKAVTYVATDRRAKPPSRRYLSALLRGARAHGLPAPYIEALESVR